MREAVGRLREFPEHCTAVGPRGGGSVRRGRGRVLGEKLCDERGSVMEQAGSSRGVGVCGGLCPVTRTHTPDKKENVGRERPTPHVSYGQAGGGD